MENHYEELSNGDAANHSLQIIRYSPYHPKISLSWFDLRVFYVRVSNFQVDESTTEFLTVNYIPQSSDTHLEVNGVRGSNYCEGVSSVLRRDRVDKRFEETTFVSTDSIKLTGSMKFEVFDKEDLILSGVVEMTDSNGLIGESKSNTKKWRMDCELETASGVRFLKGKHSAGPELLCPTIEVYVAGSSCGNPIILTKSLQLGSRKKHNRKSRLDSIPEYETNEHLKDPSHGYDMQVAGYGNNNKHEDEEEDYRNMYWERTNYIDGGEDGELSWFNAGVRVGVGIGMGVCLGIGIGVGLLVRTYQATTGTFRRRLI